MPDLEFHLHPHYRSQTPLDALLLKTDAGLDNFVTEKYHDQIAAILAEWSANLLQSPVRLPALEKVLAPAFSGSSLRPVKSKALRSGSALQVHRVTYSPESFLDAEGFIRELISAIGDFSKIVTAEFQVVRIDVNGVFSPSPQGPRRLETRVRYELVGLGSDFYREQRQGFWDLEWEAVASGGFRLRGWRATDETRSRSFAPHFADIASQALGRNPSYSQQMLRGADYWRTVLDGACGIDIYGHNGVSVGDIDNDGFDDLYVCQPAGLPNRLYRNLRDGTFEDITESAGVGILENTACALFADFNNDGYQDLLVVRANGPLLFLNEGNGKFRERSGAFQFATAPQGTFTGAAAADYNRDGLLDIYFCLYVYYRGTDQFRYPTPYFAAENGPPNFLMRNNGDGTFRDVTAESGLNQNNNRYSFCCGWSDYNRDGWPDLYVVNDFGRKNLYRNNGDGTLSDVARQAGVEDVGAGMSVCWLDYDNDGLEDLYTADMWTAAGERISTQATFKTSASESVRAFYRKHAMGNSLFRNRGASGFNDRTASAQVGNGRWSWSSDAWDFDHDGFSDLYIANGMLSGALREDLNSFFWRQVVANSPDEAKASPDYEQGWNAINELIRSDYTWSGFERNVFYANNRDGTFSDVSGAVGLDFVEDGRAFALADFDHDGRQELFLKNRNAPQLRLLKNVIKDLPPVVAVRLSGTKSNRDAIGAAVTVETESRRQTRLLQAGSGFLSQHSKELFFGLGESKGPVKVSIVWPSGLVQEFQGVPISHRIWIEEGSDTFRSEPLDTNASGHSPAPELKPQAGETLPLAVETWLLAPVPAPDFSIPDANGRVRSLSALRGRPVLLNFCANSSPAAQQELSTVDQSDARSAVRELELLTVNVDNTPDAAAIYNILYRYLFDRHRDLPLPISFLIDEHGNIVKVYQGQTDERRVQQDFRRIPQTDAERLAKALPFRGVAGKIEFGRNYLSYGSVYFQRGYFDQAGISFQFALRDDPLSAEARYGMGSVYLKQERLSEARESFESATKLKASYPDTLPNAWNNLGLLATREGRIEDAIVYFRQALQIDANHFVALQNIGNAYRQQKRWDDARNSLELALAIKPQDPEANYSLGMVLAETDDTDRAYEYLQRALKCRPAYPEALNNLGVLYLRTRRRDQAVASFEESIRVAPAFDQSYLNLARVYAVEGDREKARAVLLELLKQHPNHPLARQALEQLK